jgi:SAM-dependent methyltransferase
MSQQRALAYTSIIQRIRFAMRRLRDLIRSDYRTKASRDAERLVLDIPDGALGISIGGGPNRPHPQFVNINIEAFENVDVVGDAHRLPLADQSVDAVFSEAVFEHLHSPAIAAGEMHRVMKRGAKAFVATPFLQAYHGHPSHFQNYTLAGHKLLFERAGFSILQSGVLAGPIVAITTLAAAFCRSLLPAPLGILVAGLPVLVRVAAGPIDRLLENHPSSHVVCSATYVVLEKPRF